MSLSTIPDELELEVVQATFQILRHGGFSIHCVSALDIIYGSLDKSLAIIVITGKKEFESLFRRASFEVFSR